MSKAAQMVYYSTCHQKEPEPDTTTLAELIKDITGDQFKTLVAAVRAEPDKDKRGKLKAKLPAVLISGTEAEGRKVTKHRPAPEQEKAPALSKRNRGNK